MGESYVINKVGACRDCLVDIDALSECYKCQSMICAKHYKETGCDLCKNVPHAVCVICDNATEWYSPFDEDRSPRMTFSISFTSPYTVLDILQILHDKSFKAFNLP